MEFTPWSATGQRKPRTRFDETNLTNEELQARKERLEKQKLSQKKHKNSKKPPRKKARIENDEAGPSTSASVDGGASDIAPYDDEGSMVAFQTSERGQVHLLHSMDEVMSQSPPPPYQTQPLPQNVPSGIYDERPYADLIEMLPTKFNVINPRSKFGVWAERYLTRLPFVSSPIDANLNALTTVGPHVERLVRDVKDARESPFVTYLSHISGSMSELARRIQTELSHGKFVVVEGSPEVGGIGLRAEDLHKWLHIERNKKFDVHDLILREEDYSHPQLKDIPLHEFLANMEDPDKIQAILACSSIAGRHPTLVGHVDEGYNAYDKFQDLFKKLSADYLASRVWVLLHHSRFHTFIHHDANGLATWTAVESGEKLWVVTVLEGEREFSTREGLYDAYGKELRFTEEDGQWGFGYVEKSECYCIFARQGDMIFQPPNGWHEVYTPTNSVTIGGHFLTYDSIHLTDVGRRFDVMHPDALTNQHHESVQMTLSGMLIAIVRRSNKNYRRKSLTSLCRMVLLPHLYLIGSEEAVKLKALVAYIKTTHPLRFTNPKIPQAKASNYVLEDVERIGIDIADVLVDELCLDYKNLDAVFTPMPWTDPGEVVELSDELIYRLSKLVVQ